MQQDREVAYQIGGAFPEPPPPRRFAFLSKIACCFGAPQDLVVEHAGEHEHEEPAVGTATPFMESNRAPDADIHPDNNRRNGEDGAVADLNLASHGGSAPADDSNKRPSEVDALRAMLAEERAATQKLAAKLEKRGGSTPTAPPPANVSVGFADAAAASAQANRGGGRTGKVGFSDPSEPAPAVPPPLDKVSPVKSSMKPPELMRPVDSVRRIVERRQSPEKFAGEDRPKQRFSQTLETLEVTALEYERAADPTWNSLSKADKRNIAQEINKFKQEEMPVHEDSKHLINIHPDGKKSKIPHAAFAEHVGKQVIVIGLGKGVLKYYGKHHAQAATCAGVAMDEPIGKHDGSVDGHAYFDCTPGHGLVLDPRRLELVDDYVEILDNSYDIGSGNSAEDAGSENTVVVVPPDAVAAMAAVAAEAGHTGSDVSSVTSSLPGFRDAASGNSVVVPPDAAAAMAAAAAEAGHKGSDVSSVTSSLPGFRDTSDSLSQAAANGTPPPPTIAVVDDEAAAPPTIAVVDDETGVVTSGEFLELSPTQASAALAKDGSLRIGFGGGSERAAAAPAAAAAAVEATATAARNDTLAPAQTSHSKRQASLRAGFGTAGSVRMAPIPGSGPSTKYTLDASGRDGADGPGAAAQDEQFVELSPGSAAAALVTDGSLRIGFGGSMPSAAAEAPEPFKRDGSLQVGFDSSNSTKSATLPAGFTLAPPDSLMREGSLQVGFGAAAKDAGTGENPSANIMLAARAAAAADFPPGMSTLKSVSGWNLGDRCTAPGPTGGFEPVVIQGWLLEEEDAADDDMAVLRLDKSGAVYTTLISSLMDMASEA